VKETARPSAGRPNMPLLMPRQIHLETTLSPAAFAKISIVSFRASINRR
jgi:hypothetical protein